MNTRVFNSLVAFLDKLEHQKISYTLAHNREEAIMVLVAIPGERWEIEFMSDGSVEIEKFISTGEISGIRSLDELFVRYTVQEASKEFPTEAELVFSDDKTA